MGPLTALTDVLYREEVARARAMAPGDKLLESSRALISGGSAPPADSQLCATLIAGKPAFQ